jgi:hypothetical protein
MACVMLIAAGLLVRSLQATKSIPLGFNAEKVFTAHIYLTDKQQRDATRTQPFFQSLLIGIAGSLVAGKSIESLLYGISPVDLLTVGVAIIVLGVTGLLACLFPAIRASRIDPIIVLKA